MKLKDKVTIITGGSRGIGFATADKFLSEDGKVIITASTQASADKAVAKLKEKYPESVVAGIIETDMMKAVPKEVIDPMIARIPLRRLGQPEDIAKAFTFLASDEASYIKTGRSGLYQHRGVRRDQRLAGRDRI